MTAETPRPSIIDVDDDVDDVDLDERGPGSRNLCSTHLARVSASEGR
jgi:hypothetical protein